MFDGAPLTGHFCVQASFRSALFSVPQHLFIAIPAFSDDSGERHSIGVEVQNELVVAVLLTPLAYTNLGPLCGVPFRFPTRRKRAVFRRMFLIFATI